MAVLAIYTYSVKPGRMNHFLGKLSQAASPQFKSAVMPKNVRLFRNTVPGPETELVELHIEYEDMAAFGARNVFEHTNKEWQDLFAAEHDSPETLVSVKLLTEMNH